MRRSGLLAVALLAGCASGGREVPPGMIVGAPTSKQVAEEFLQAANAKDYSHMSALFGTEKGPAIERFGVAEIERRMVFLAALLKHSDYQLETGRKLTQRANQIRYVARMTGTRNGTIDVPIVTVTNGSRWFVEQLETDQLAGP